MFSGVLLFFNTILLILGELRVMYFDHMYLTLKFAMSLPMKFNLCCLFILGIGACSGCLVDLAERNLTLSPKVAAKCQSLLSHGGREHHPLYMLGFYLA